MAHFKYLNLDYSEVFIFDDFLVKQIKEGEHVDEKHLAELKNIIAEYFSEKDFVYISNRVNSYSVYPLLYSELAKIENVKGVGIISENSLTVKNAEFEKAFYSKPFKTFHSLSGASAWVYKLLNNEV